MKLLGNIFDTAGISALKNALLSDSEWVSIDEIGYLESHCMEYLSMITKIMDQKHLLAVVRKQHKNKLP